MSVSRLGSRNKQNDYTWPGFVDALASLLMVFVFVLMVFVLIQANLAYRLSSKDESLATLQTELATIASLLGKERAQNTKLSLELTSSIAALKQAQDEIASLSSALAKSEEASASQLEQLRALNATLAAQAARNDELTQSLANMQASLKIRKLPFLRFKHRMPPCYQKKMMPQLS